MKLVLLVRSFVGVFVCHLSGRRYTVAELVNLYFNLCSLVSSPFSGVFVCVAFSFYVVLHQFYVELVYEYVCV